MGTNVSLEYLPSCQGIGNKALGKMFLLGVSRKKKHLNEDEQELHQRTHF